jgi:outer membrane protein
LKRIKLIGWGLMLGMYIAPVNVLAEEIRLGVVNPIRVLKELEETPRVEEIRKTLKREFASREQKIVATQNRIKQLEGRLAKEEATMSDIERRRLTKDINNSKRDLERDQQEFRDDLNFRHNEEFGKIQKQIVKAIEAVAKEGDYDVVVGEGVIFASKRVDITDKVVERLKAGK